MPQGDSAIVSRLPVRPNARVDGLDARTANLAAFLAREAKPPSPGARTSEQGAQIMFAGRAREVRRRRLRRAVGASSAFGALVAAGLVAWTATHRVPLALSYTVDGTVPPVDGYVRSSGAHEPELAFSDGTSIRMMPMARARVLEVGQRGARLMLEEGRAHVHVAHRPGADWQVQAGAFVIHVHGTSFFVEWTADEARLDVKMESGEVAVDGPRPGDTVILRAGQSISVGPHGPPVVSPTPPTSSRPALAPSAPEVAPAAAAPVAPVLAPSPVAPRVVPSAGPLRARWSDRLADGDAAGIVAEAQRRGLGTVLGAASSEDLAALADAARFRNQDRLARRVLLAQRGRFPGTLRAEEASFLLGRLADGPGGRASEALAWYDRYLREAPSGAYAAEAMGRMMTVLGRQQRTDEARAVAAAYLRRFPQGVYARTARAVTSPTP